MRKLRRRGAQAAETPAAPVAVAAAPVAAAPVAAAPVAAAPVAQLPATVPDAGALAALTGNALLAQIGTWQRPEALLPEGAGQAYLAFYSQKGADAAAVVQALGSSVEGTPYIKADGRIFPAAQAAFCVIREYPFWVTLDRVSFRPNRAWTKPQAFGASYQGDAIKEQILTIALILPGGAPLHEDLQPAIPTLTTWRATKCGAVKTHCDAIEATIPDPSDKTRMETATAWAQANGPLVNVQPRFRLCSTLRMEPKSGSNGPYALAKAIPAAISIAQMAALDTWARDEELQEEFRQVSEAYDRQVAEVQAMAEATAK